MGIYCRVCSATVGGYKASCEANCTSPDEERQLASRWTSEEAVPCVCVGFKDNDVLEFRLDQHRSERGVPELGLALVGNFLGFLLDGCFSRERN